ncbi:trihelix transcription factor ASR3 [Humulus lupulus]|uniref:trihelix transcription factor ASR3 n=1 Tax=Humulus lupulus TaxID=3486 RepID=UPI002B4048A6|nr:trihelix transcription factor ASR3 [Humulus lupulus]
MALELSLPTNPVDTEADGVTNGVDARPSSTDGGDDGRRAPRLPRWTRQEILVLIQGKRVAESKVRRIRTAGAAFGSGQVEPKWASVSSYCRMHGVNRGPVQCRKRWSNLAGDYKKIKEWELQRKDGSDSFWAMRNDLRRERKLPGFFDKEVFDILDAGSGGGVGQQATPVVAPPPAEEMEKDATAEEPEENTVMFDSRRGATAEDGMFSDFEQEDSVRSPVKEAAAATATKEAPPAASMGIPAVPISSVAAANVEQPTSNPEIGSTSQEGRKRRRMTFDGDGGETSLQNQLIDVLERNGKAVASHLDAQNTHFQLDREQRKNHSDSLVAVLNKLADALVRISEKL